MADSANDDLLLSIQHAGEQLTISLPPDATFRTLGEKFAEAIDADVEKVALWPKPKPGYLKYPFSEERVAGYMGPKFSIKGIGTPRKTVKQNDEVAQAVSAKLGARSQAQQAARSTRRAPVKDWARVQQDAKYTFYTIEPLQYLPNPSKSKRYLERLANDPGIRFSMRKHKFSVGLLTEMNPAEHTTHESKTLGLNRNRGEAIELRLRTDSYDGYRDYKVIRKTLCHELAHNVFSEHDRDFWDLTKQIEQEVERNDTQHGGHQLSADEFYVPDDQYDETHTDSGGWQGGEYVLGGQANAPGLSRRDLLARAAEIRSRNAKNIDSEEQQQQPENNTGPQG